MKGGDRGEQQKSKQIIHTQWVSIFWSLSLCPVVVRQRQLCLYLEEGIFLTPLGWRLFPLIMAEHTGAGRGWRGAVGCCFSDI